MLKFISFTRTANPDQIIRMTLEKAEKALAEGDLHSAKNLLHSVLAKQDVYPSLSPEVKALAGAAKQQLRSVYEALGEDDLIFCWF